MSEEFNLAADALWLDFVNTSRGPGREDTLPDLAAYHRWTKASRLPSDADETDLATLRQLRARLRAIAVALVEGEPAPPGGVALLNDLLSERAGHEQLVRESGRWQIRFLPGGPVEAVVAIARSATADLAADPCVVRQCASPTCDRFFRDHTPNSTRRICGAATCGGPGRVERRRTALT